MQIEESSRGMKSTRYGFAFRENLVWRPERVAVLLLLNTVATLARWLAGLPGERCNLIRGLQANARRRQRVLSFLFIRIRLFEQGIQFTQQQCRHAFSDLQSHIEQQSFEYQL